MAHANEVLATLWSAVGGDAAALDRVHLTGSDPVLPSSFAVGALAQAAIAGAGLAATEVYRARGGAEQTVSVDMQHAAVEFRSERYVRTPTPPGPMWDAIAGLYRTRDQRWVRMHTNFTHHRDGIIRLLGCDDNREAVQSALQTWEALAFEEAAAAANMVVTMTRSPAEWAAAPQGKAVRSLPLVEIERIQDAPTEPLPPGARPLSGVRVLDLTRIIAGPVAGRTLAVHGADVLHVTCDRLPTIPQLGADTNRGKRTASIDLDSVEGRETMQTLVREADVFMQGYRPGGIAQRGFSESELTALRPGIVVVSLSAYGHVGPWAGRRGFDSLTQNANGINWDEAVAASPDGTVSRPRELPAQALDHAAGYVLAIGAMLALKRRAEVGGSWRVRTSLAQIGEWLKSLPRIADGFGVRDASLEDIPNLLETTPSGFGPLTAVRHAAKLSLTPAYWALPAVPLGSHAPEWFPRPA